MEPFGAFRLQWHKGLLYYKWAETSFFVYNLVNENHRYIQVYEPLYICKSYNTVIVG